MSDPTGDHTTWADRGWYLAIEFQQSSSAHFERAVRAAAKHPGFAALIDEGGTCIYRVLAGPDDLGTLPRLLDLIRNWKDARFYIRGRPVDVETVEAWLGCYLMNRGNPSPPCRRGVDFTRIRTPVGCIYASILLGPSDWDAWYGDGEFDAQGAYHIHKERIVSRIDSWERLYGGCPFADAEMLRRVVERLPETLYPREDPIWRVEHVYWGSGLRLVPRSVEAYVKYLRELLADAG